MPSQAGNPPDESRRANPTRGEALDDWLDRVGARLLWSAPVTGRGGRVLAYAVNGRVALVHRNECDAGWEIYVPAAPTNLIAETLRAAESALGVAPPGPGVSP